MESGDDGLESEANVRPRPCLTRVGLPRGSPGARWTAIDRGLFAGSTGASAAKSKRQGSRNRPFSTIPKMWKDSVRQAASLFPSFVAPARVTKVIAATHSKPRGALQRPSFGRAIVIGRAYLGESKKCL